MSAPDGGGRRRASSSSAPRATATASRALAARHRRPGRSIPKASRRPTSSPSTRRAARPACRSSSSAPARTGATAPTSRAPTESLAPRRCSSSLPRAVLRRQAGAAADPRLATTCRSGRCSPRRCPTKAGRKVEIRVPQRGEKRELVEHALANAREALGRKLAESSSQRTLLGGLAERFGLAERAAAHRGLRQQPHHGHERGRRHDRRRAGGLRQRPVPQVQHQVGRR